MRAVLLPLDRVRALDGAEGVSALAVSLGEARPTHVLLVGDPLPDAVAASALLAGGRPADLAGSALRLGDDAFTLSGTPQPLERFLEVGWTPDVLPARPAPPELVVGLVPTDEVRPIAAIVLRDRAAFEEHLWSWPESRFQPITFAADDREVILRSADPRALEGIEGEAFYALDALYLPVGRSLAPAFARAWLPELLGPGDVFFWRETFIQSVASSAFVPLDRRRWRGCFHASA